MIPRESVGADRLVEPRAARHQHDADEGEVRAQQGAQLADPDSLHQEADLLYELFALSDERAAALLVALDQDPEDAVRQVGRMYESLDAVRSLAAPPGTPTQQDREAA